MFWLASAGSLLRNFLKFIDPACSSKACSLLHASLVTQSCCSCQSPCQCIHVASARPGEVASLVIQSCCLVNLQSLACQCIHVASAGVRDWLD